MDKIFLKKERGAAQAVQTTDKKMCVVKWLDNKPILMASTSTGIQPEGLVKRWSKKDKKYVQVKCPACSCPEVACVGHDSNSLMPQSLRYKLSSCIVVQKYNSKMGGVDMIDRMISYYRTKARTKKWTVRTVFHFFDLAVTNGWIQYRDDRRQFGDRRKEIAQVTFSDFCLISGLFNVFCIQFLHSCY